MFPMSELQKLDLEAAGLEIQPQLIYNPDGLSLVDGICKIGGCTGSFVSDQGLMLTNHHCAFRAIRDASDPEHDYLADGFVAPSLRDEVPAVGFTVRITESYRDVSEQVLAVVREDMLPIERTKAIEKRLKELSLAEEKSHPGKRCEISEMFQGKTYVLFTYTYLKDVRLVYAPPQSIGNFGGEEDNWMWPRHSGDFSFMRAYVAPDGSSAEYADENVPYRPRQVLEVAGEGVAEGDFVFIFGYPGSTYRHRSAAYLENLSTFFMPTVVDWYGWLIQNLEASAQGDRARQLALADRVKSLHNTYKNFRGKLHGIERLDLVAKRRAEEADLARFIAADPQLQARYGNVLPGLQEYYGKDQARSGAGVGLHGAQPGPHPQRTEGHGGEQRPAGRCPDHGRTAAPGGRHPPGGGTGTFPGYDWRGRTPPGPTVPGSDLCREPPHGSGFPSEGPGPGHGMAGVAGGPLPGSGGPDYLGQNFVPDANGTLRFTYGRIEGYSPRDAVWLQPFTRLEGLLEKETGEAPFVLPAGFRELVAAADFGPFAQEDIGGVPVNMLYSTDTTGGNSGSPVLNARGQVVGLNFDRAWEATINDFAWDQSYSRSIGVDIRYVLWVTWKIGGAERLLLEMGVAPR